MSAGCVTVTANVTSLNALSLTKMVYEPAAKLLYVVDDVHVVYVPPTFNLV